LGLGEQLHVYVETLSESDLFVSGPIVILNTTSISGKIALIAGDAEKTKTFVVAVLAVICTIGSGLVSLLRKPINDGNKFENYSELLSEQDIYDIIAYLLTLQ